MQSDLSWLALCIMMYRPSSFRYLMSVLDLLLKPQLAYRMAPAISKHAHRPSPSDVCLSSIVCDMVPCTGTRACLHSQTQRRVRKSAWYTLFAHALNHHRIPWRLCSLTCTYVYWWHCVDVPVYVQLVFCSTRFYIALFYAFWWLDTSRQRSRKNRLPPMCLPKKHALYAVVHQFL